LNGTTACKWDSVIPFNKHIMATKGRSKKLVPMYEDEWVMRELSTTHKSIHQCREEFQEQCQEGMWDKLNKLIKPNGAIVLFGSEPFSSALRMSNIKNYKYDWVWQKHKASNFMLAKKQPMKVTENISVFYENQPIYNPQMRELTEQGKKRNNRTQNGKFNKTETVFGDTTNLKVLSYKDKKTGYPLNVVKFNGVVNNQFKKDLVHPTQKPVELIEYLIKTYTNEGDLVLDFTAGSFTTCVAGQNTNRRTIGVEMDEKYFDIGVERVKKQ